MTRADSRDWSIHQMTCKLVMATVLALAIGSGVSKMSARASSAITSSCPSVCFCDETNYVNCVGDGLWEVPTDIPKTVVRLELRNYIIGVLSMSAVQELVDLLELKLQQTKIQSIENGTFGNLTRLLRLDLSQNLMESIGSIMFEGLNSLRYLDLSTNRLANMDEPFVDLVNLEQLNLRENLLPQLTTDSFAGLYKVQYLNLDSNHITSIEVGTFQYLTNLAHLIVSNNPLTALSRLDFFGSRLQYIDVSRVGLQRVPQSLTRYVRDLRLAKNNLTHIRLGDFDSYPYLSLLVLDDNWLEDIESDALGRQEYLVRLWLNGNMLQQIPANLPPSLRVLYAEENLLKVIAPFSFQGLFNMEQLFLQRNQIKRLDPCAFCDLLSLRHLDLQANMLEILSEGAFANLSNLVSLDLSQNPIKILSEGCFSGLENLKTLQLSRMKTQVQFNGSVFNPLKKLDTLEVYDSPDFVTSLVTTTRALQGLRSLRELNLMHNNLVSLRPDFPNFFPQLKVAKLGDNLWTCDKDTLWLANWIKKADTHFYHSYSIRCNRPPELLHKPIMMLRAEDFMPSTTVATSTEVATEIRQQSTVTTISLAPTIPPPTVEIEPITINNTSTSPHPMDSNRSPKDISDSHKTVNATSSGPSSSVADRVMNTASTAVTSTTPVVDTTAVTMSTIIPKAMTEREAITFSSTMMTTSALETSTAASMPQKLDSETNTSTPYSSTSPASSVPHASFSKSTITSTDNTELNSSESFQKDAASESPTSSDVPQTNSTFSTVTVEELPTTATPRDGYDTEGHGGEPDLRDGRTTSNSGFGEVQGSSVVVVVAATATCLGLLVLGLAMSFFLVRCRRGHLSSSSSGLGLNCRMRRSSSSISYSPQRDEVSIVTVSEGTVGLHTLTHQGLSNKLYFVLENGSDSSSSSRDIAKEALPDPSLRELLPDTTNCYPTVRQTRTLSRKARAYCLNK